jgi:CubicO group peptidase (beta-lactamase class C family)
MRRGAESGPGENDVSRAERCLASLVSRRAVPSMAYAVVRDGDATVGGFGGAEPRTIFEIGSLTAGVQPSPLDAAVFEALG